MYEKIDGPAMRLQKCGHCGGKPEFKSKQGWSGSYFWHVACMQCGCSTYRDDNGFGYEGNEGKIKAAEDWNQRFVQEKGVGPALRSPNSLHTACSTSPAHMLDMGAVFANGKPIGVAEALSGVKPIDWSKEVMDGRYRDQAIIKAKE